MARDDGLLELSGVSAATAALREELLGGKMRVLGTFPVGDHAVTVSAGVDSVWAMVRRGDQGLALRCAYAPGGIKVRKRRRGGGERIRLEMTSAMGMHRIILSVREDDLPVLRVTTTLTPVVPLLITHLPRDLYLLGTGDDPYTARGRVEAAQRGLNGGLCYVRREEPGAGSILYVQNLTALNDYFIATKTKPDGAVGGEWPEMGYLPPTPPQSGVTPVDPLPAGRETVISDALLAFHDENDADEQATALRFLTLLGAIYRLIDRPETEFRDWVGRARRTLQDLETAPEASIVHYGHRYIHPYTATEYPDIMVQMSLIASLRDFGAWSHQPSELEAELGVGLDKFHDRKLGTMRRYLPNVGKDKDKDAVDSWYLYHSLLNLGKMALDGDRRGKRLFLASIDYAIRAAHHFEYKWPIQFKVDDFSTIVAARNDDGLGQTDVGGLYAYVMLQAYELTRDERFVVEARAALDAAREMRFELNYQANLTAWGAAACMRLWRITNEATYLGQSYVYLANFFHNTVLWQSRIGAARHYPTFLAVTALHDAPYVALYECFDSFAAFERYLSDSGPQLEPAVRLLVSEYCRFALNRAWFYYPDALPEDILATEIRNGHIDRKLSFPLEDLYPDGQPPGQVGQEIYGAGAAFVFASRTFHPVPEVPFTLFCDHFVVAMKLLTSRSISIELNGAETMQAGLSLVKNDGQDMPGARVVPADGTAIAPHHRQDDRIDYRIPANGRVVIHW